MSGGTQSSDKFSRFGDKRKIGSDTSGYDEYVEGVEADETTSLETPLQEDNMGFKLIQKLGWQNGTGLGKFEQGRVDPVPFEMKDDHMGLGRWTLELELAQDATEKRRQMEAEKELTDDLMEKYREKAEKDKMINETLTEMNKAFYCELCDRQYTKYSEYDNHINSYSHHHEQRLRDLKEYETGRKFGGRRGNQEQKEKMLAAQMVAIERAQMRMRQQKRKKKGTFSPGFKPIGDPGGGVTSIHDISTSNSSESMNEKRPLENTESQEKIAEKKRKLARYGLKFQSAGTLMSIGELLGKDTPLQQGSPAKISEKPNQLDSEKITDRRAQDKAAMIQGIKGSYTTMWDKEGETGKRADISKPLPVSSQKAPPPLMSRQRELIMEKAAGSDSDDEDQTLTAKTLIKRTPVFKFKIGKK